MKTQTTIRVEKDTFLEAKEILKELGLNYSQAVNIFNAMIAQYKGLPFEVKLPNKETMEALEELKNRQGKTFKNVDELFEDLDD